MKKTTAAVFLGSALILGSACGVDGREGDGTGDDDPGDDDPNNPGTTQRCNKMDLIFVVDDSGSMSEEQTNLALNFPAFANVLDNFVDSDGNQLDYRVAVTTTGKNLTQTITINFVGAGVPPMTMTVPSEGGDNGAFRNNCNVDRRWLEPTDALDSALPCRAAVGTNGPGVEMPLIATKLALADRMQDGTNAGFIREDALLGVVMLTDEDDSSVIGDTASQTISMDFSAFLSGGVPEIDPIADYHPADLVDFLDQTKGHRSKWAAGVIAGQTSCTSSYGDAVEATRLKDFVNMANGSGTEQAVFSSICDGNMAQALTQVVDKFQNACGAIIL